MVIDPILGKTSLAGISVSQRTLAHGALFRFQIDIALDRMEDVDQPRISCSEHGQITAHHPVSNIVIH